MNPGQSIEMKSGGVITLTDEQFSEMKAELVAALLADKGRSLTLISKAQAAGLLDIDAKTLDALPIKRVVIAAKKKIAYRLADIAEFVEANME